MPQHPSSSVSFITPEGKLVSGFEKRIRYEPYIEQEESLYGHGPALQLLENAMQAKYRQDMVPFDSDLQKVIEQQSRDKAEYIRTLETLLRERGIDANLTQQFHHLAQHGMESDAQLYTVKPVIVMRDFAVSKKEFPNDVEQEVRSPYCARFGILRRDVARTTIGVPLFEMDKAAWDVLKKFGVSDAMQKAYCEDFLRMADVSDHDYMHQMIDTALPLAPYEFPDRYETGTVSPFRHEDMLFALQAKICRRMFAAHPEFKAQVLQWAARQANRIGQMEEIALTNAEVQGADPQEIYTATHYFASFFMHRMLRVFAMDDPDLQTPLTLKVNGQTITTSVAEQFDYIRSIASHVQGHDGFQALTKQCDAQLSGTYERIHHMDTVALYELAHPASEPHDLSDAKRIEVPLEEVLHLFGKAVPPRHVAALEQQIIAAGAGNNLGR